MLSVDGRTVVKIPAGKVTCDRPPLLRQMGVGESHKNTSLFS